MENIDSNIERDCVKESVSPPRMPESVVSLQTTKCYEKQTVEELFGLLLQALEKSERECLYWSTMYEEGQKDLFALRERIRKEDEAEYIDPDHIPNDPRRGSKPSLEAPAEEQIEDDVPRWYSLKAAVKSAMSAVVGGSPKYSATQRDEN